MKTEVISFRKLITTGQIYDSSSDSSTIKERLKANGRVTEFRIRFYPGVEKALEVKPFVRHKGKRDENFITFGENSDTVISGDNDYFVFPTSVDFETDDEIHVYVKNTNWSNFYTLSVDVIVTYFDDEVM